LPASSSRTEIEVWRASAIRLDDTTESTAGAVRF
jgi:hypothetical protein